ncbi:MAG: hypothetical protein EBQ92_00575 [Proteobacteria bacterium]|nr:hypothetical protein [Pseudomonadota bacterium]
MAFHPFRESDAWLRECLQKEREAGLGKYAAFKALIEGARGRILFEYRETYPGEVIKHGGRVPPNFVRASGAYDKQHLLIEKKVQGFHTEFRGISFSLVASANNETRFKLSQTEGNEIKKEFDPYHCLDDSFSFDTIAEIEGFLFFANSGDFDLSAGELDGWAVERDKSCAVRASGESETRTHYVTLWQCKPSSS